MRHIRSTTKYRNSLARICEEQGHRSPGRAQGKKNQRRSEPAISAADMARRASILSHIICFVTCVVTRHAMMQRSKLGKKFVQMEIRVM